MGTKIVYLLLGPLSLVWLSGCGTLRNCCSEGCFLGSCIGETPRRKKLDSQDGPPRLLPDTKPTALEKQPEAIKVAEQRTPETSPLNTASKPIAPLDTLSLPMSNPAPAPIQGRADEMPVNAKPGSLAQIEIMPLTEAPVAPPTKKSDASREVKSEFRPLERDVPIQKKPMATPEAKSLNSTDHREAELSTLKGQVQRYRKAWRLRYADAGQEDRYGGVVTLEGGAELDKLQDGQRVRVTGELMPPPDRASQARYRVRSLEILD